MRWLASLLCALWCGVVLAGPVAATSPPLPPQSVPLEVARVFTRGRAGRPGSLALGEGGESID